MLPMLWVTRVDSLSLASLASDIAAVVLVVVFWGHYVYGIEAVCAKDCEYIIAVFNICN